MPRILLDAFGNATNLHLLFHMTWNTQLRYSQRERKQKKVEDPTLLNVTLGVTHAFAIRAR